MSKKEIKGRELERLNSLLQKLEDEQLCQLGVVEYDDEKIILSVNIYHDGENFEQDDMIIDRKTLEVIKD